MQFGNHPFLAGGLLFAAVVITTRASLDERTYNRVLASEPAVGDIVFTRIRGPIFTRVATTTQSWTSHVGIIVDYRRGDWVVAESGIPFVRRTPLRKFLGRSADQRFSIRRLKDEPNDEEKRAMLAFADSQIGRPYALGFDLKSRKTFCSKFVHDVIYACTGQSIGEIETFEQMLHRNPHASLAFWRVWFFGFIPWQRTTITPASELDSPLLKTVIQNRV
jgi:hypothetical protein